MPLPEARETVSAGPRSERGCFLPITSSSGLTPCAGSAAQGDGKTALERHSLFSPRLRGFPALCIELAKGLGDGLTECSFASLKGDSAFLWLARRTCQPFLRAPLPPSPIGMQSQQTALRCLPCFTCFNVDATW